MHVLPPKWSPALFFCLSILSAAPTAATGQPDHVAPTQMTGVLISDATGVPLKNAKVGLCEYLDSDAVRDRQAAGRFVPEPIRSTTTDASGRFTIPVPAIGPMYLIAHASGHAGSIISRPLAAPADLGVIRLPVGRRLAGTVVGPDGSPIAKARVLSMASEADHERNYKPQPLMGEALSDAKGHFVLEEISPQRVPILVIAEGMAFRPQGIDKKDEELIVRLQPAVTVSGRVVAPDGATPVPGAWVTAKDGAAEPIAKTGTDGRFELGRLSPTEGATISARTPRIAPEAIAFHAPSAETKIRPGAIAPLTLRLLPGARLRARVVDQTSRAPVPLARINLHHGAGSETALTDGGGEAVFAGIAPGRLYGYVKVDGYGEASSPALVVRQGEDQQIGIPMKKTASIKGRVITSKGRQSVEGVALLAGTMFPDAMGLKVKDTIELEGIRSAADGTFLLQGIPSEEKVLIEARLAGYATAQLEIGPLSAGERHEGAEIVLEQGLPIVGMILDPDGVPVEGAEVVAVDAAGGETAERLSLADTSFDFPLERAGDPSLPKVNTDDKGQFSIPGARAGRWSIAVKADGFARKLVRGVVVEAPGGANTGEIALERGVRVRGRVVDSEGRSVSGVRLYLRDAAEWVSRYDVEQHEDGTFQSGDLPTGRTFTLTASADGYLGFELKGLAPPKQDLLVTLSTGVSLAGQVLDARTGAPVTDYTVSVHYPRTDEAWKQTFEFGDSESIRSETGRFSLPSVRPGRVRLEVTAPGRVKAIVDGLEVQADGLQDEITVRLQPSVMLTGVVVDDEGHPVSDVRVEKEAGAASGMSFAQLLGVDSDAEMTKTDMEGAFRLELPDAEALRLSFEHDGFLSAELSVDPAVQRDGLRVTMRRGVVLTGLVVKEHDKGPVRGARVIAMRSGAGFLSSSVSAKSGPDGSFRIEGLRPGTYEVSASADGLRDSPSESILVKEGLPSTSVTLTLAGGTQLNGTITGLDPADLENLTVSTGRFRASDPAAVDRDGRFQIDGLAAGRNVLLIRWSGPTDRSMAKTVEIPEGVSTWQETIELGSGVVVSGTVSLGTKTLAGAEVHFTDRATGVRVMAESAADGNYSVRDLRTGTYQVAVRHKETFQIRSVGALAVQKDRVFNITLPAGQISGTVTSVDSGRVISGATVSIEPATPAPTVEEQAAYLLMARAADEEGRYVIRGVADGVYRLTASAAGHGYESREVKVTGDSHEAIISFSLSPANPLSVRVLLTATGEPAVGGIFVLALVAGRQDPLGASGSGDKIVYQGVSIPDESGRFGIESLKPGTYDIVLWIPGLAPEILHDVVVPAAEITASLGPGVALVLNGAGIPDGPAGRAVLLDAQGRPAYQQALMADAGFELQKGMEGMIGIVKPGTYIVRGRLPDGKFVEKTIMVLAGDNAVIVIP